MTLSGRFLLAYRLFDWCALVMMRDCSLLWWVTWTFFSSLVMSKLLEPLELRRVLWCVADVTPMGTKKEPRILGERGAELGVNERLSESGLG
jgi:hypothetical protein